VTNELEFLKELARASGYRFERDPDGTERMIRPDGTVAVMTKGEPDAIRLRVADHAPEGVYFGADGALYRDIDGTVARVCEDCFEPIPRYQDFPQGLVSPESDGDAGGNFAKIRTAQIEDKTGLEHVQKIVCLPCYRAAFARVYPHADPPDLRSIVVEGQESYDPHRVEPCEYVPDPRDRRA
jgi:hypothetical protein